MTSDAETPKRPFNFRSRLYASTDIRKYGNEVEGVMPFGDVFFMMSKQIIYPG